MSRKIYNKLIRDKISEIIKEDKRNPKIRIMDEGEYRQELFNKVVEEAKELMGTNGEKKEMIKEIGDVYEVIDTIIKAYGLSKDEIKEMQDKRRFERGGFEKKLFLEYVDE
ncbi:nucleoside triphosphate pyrophosphohydrolase [Candidatus Parcubacteria bacterium]|nr:nucleoside triphosphate pyrophosphohydrolase [Candidatus Parcubacteria bacterium]